MNIVLIFTQAVQAGATFNIICVTSVSQLFRLDFPMGHADTQMPQTVASMFIRVLLNDWQLSLHLCALKNASLSVLTSHSCPVAASTGQDATQILHLPHLLLLIGTPDISRG